MSLGKFWTNATCTYKGRIYDPCCGSGGMFVQSEKFVEAHGGWLGDISIYGQESNATTRRLAMMNLAIRAASKPISAKSRLTPSGAISIPICAPTSSSQMPNCSDWFSTPLVAAPKLLPRF